MEKRTTKWYRKNEAEVIQRLGFEPTRNSGATWIDKGDGQNESFICELKSTDKESYTLKQKTLQELEYHACVAHKTPVFALQFLNRDEIWVAVKEEDFKEFIEFKKQKQKEQEADSFLDSFVDKEVKEEYNIYMPSRNAGKTYLARHAYMKQKEQEREQKETEFRKRQKELEKRNRERRKKQVGKEI